MMLRQRAAECVLWMFETLSFHSGTIHTGYVFNWKRYVDYIALGRQSPNAMF